MKHEPEENSPAASHGPAQSVTDPASLLAAIVGSAEDAIISKDLNGLVTSWNEAANRIFGYTEREMVGQSILRLIPRELHSEEAEILRKIRAGEKIESYETTRIRKNGEAIAVSLTISPLRDPSGRIVGASKIARDISERRRGDDARTRLAAIVDSSDDAILSKNLQGIITSWNQAATRIFGYTAEEMVGQSILRLIPEELQYEEERILSAIRAGERIDHFETVRIRKDGERIEVSVTISPLKDGRGRVIGASKIARDISGRKQVERLLVQSEKLAATGRMAASIAHEINNPLESLMNLVYLARRSSSANDKAYGYLLTAEKEIERVSHIARQTLGYYRESRAAVDLHLSSLLEDVLSVYQSKLSAGGVAVDCRFEDSHISGANRGELVQVFSNIIANAIDAMPSGGTLHVHTYEVRSHEAGGIETLIRDEGMGIAQEHLKRIFEPFFTTKGDLGTGIGLWVAKQLVEKHGGQITITSSTERPKSGTSVSIFLPHVAFASGGGPDGDGEVKIQTGEARDAGK
ncbi:MAG TPA: PAS domain S-box protein [Acidobacteriaceae bacterium]|nr:PAS domain S-box protein [Acidobacteriaceae bacterium]